MKFQYRVYLLAGILYLVGAWLHYPYGGGHFYSDITAVFQMRVVEHNLGIPIIQVFSEYPPIVSSFMYMAGILGNLYPGSLIYNYYYVTVTILAIPTFLLIKETMKIAEIIAIGNKRILPYLVVTPTFVFILLLNWYVIGVYFMIVGLRKFMQGDRTWSGILVGVSAASNFVTAVPALGMIYTAGSWRKGGLFVGAALATYLAINAPFLLLNPQSWFSAWSYIHDYEAEGSWMLLFFSNMTPFRHIIPIVTFSILSTVIVWRAWRTKTKDTIKMCWLFAFAYLFSTYIVPPQTNMIMFPFFVLAPIVKRYWEFLAFDIVTSFITFGNSSASGMFFQLFGINYYSLVWGQITYPFIHEWAAIIRSFWIGKLVVFDGLISSRGLRQETVRVSQPIIHDNRTDIESVKHGSIIKKVILAIIVAAIVSTGYTALTTAHNPFELKTVNFSVDKLTIDYDDMQTWTANGLPPNAGYTVTLRSLANPTIYVLGSGNANDEGEAGGSFLVGRNLASGSTSLRIEMTSDPSTFKETRFIIGETVPTIEVTVEKLQVSYDDMQTWTANGLPPNAGYTVTLRSLANPVVVVLGSGNANDEGEAGGSFLVGRNLAFGDTILRVALSEEPENFGESNFQIG